MDKICISADSTFDMTPEMADHYEIKVIPSYVRMDATDYFDYPDIKQEALFEYYNQTKSLPQTAAANPAEYEKFFKECLAEYDSVVHIAKSAGMSCCYENAMMAARKLNNVYVVDSMTISGGSALLALEAVNQKESFDVMELQEHLCEYRERITGSFIVETVEYLHEGGRCSTLTYFGASAMQIKPSIIIRDGKLTVGKKYMGSFRRCLRGYIDTTLSPLEEKEDDILVVAHAIQDEALLNFVLEQVENKHHFKEIYKIKIGAAVACHGGPNVFGVFFVKK
jgi:DegV family protein with EDD domain